MLDQVVEDTRAGKRAKRYDGRLRAFKSADAAREAGEFFRDISRKAQNESTNTTGGFVVPELIADAIIALRERVGVFRSNALVVPMAADSVRVSRRTTSPTGYFVSEASAVTESQTGFSSITLSAKKIAALVRSSSELEDDAAGLGDFLTAELAYALAFLEDNTAFNGDGTSAFGGIYGLTKKIIDGTHTKSAINAASTHDTFAEIDVTDLATALSALPSYALANARWYCSQPGYAFVFCRLAAGAGGIQMADVGGQMMPHFWGLPVVRSNLLPTSTGSLNAMAMLFCGDMAQAGTLGARRAVNVRRNESKYLEYDATLWRATSRFDVNLELGDNSAPGSIIAVIGN